MQSRISDFVRVKRKEEGEALFSLNFLKCQPGGFLISPTFTSADRHAGSGVARKMDPICYLAGCRTRRLNQEGRHILAFFFIVLLFIRPLLCIVNFHCMCSVFWLF